jgi:hypothetical protein
MPESLTDKRKQPEQKCAAMDQSMTAYPEGLLQARYLTHKEITVVF